MATLFDMAQESSTREWTLTGRNSLVKVLSPQAVSGPANGGTADSRLLGGYFTLGKYIWGMTAAQIERRLGLLPLSLRDGVFIYGFSRLPSVSETEFKYSLAWPDGKVPTPQEYQAMLERRDAALAGLSSEPHLYPPGAGHIPQWRLKHGVQIQGHLLQHLTGNAVFLRGNGSSQPYAPHNRQAQFGRVG